MTSYVPPSEPPYIISPIPEYEPCIPPLCWPDDEIHGEWCEFYEPDGGPSDEE